ncbi:MAG: hypothetical protein AB2L24_21700 [Mangrovibacterium sp.]
MNKLVSKPNQKEQKIKAWEQHYSMAKEKQSYSIGRIDLLTVSISGACIYIVFEILRFLNGPDAVRINSDTTLLKFSAIASVLAIAINFFSQIMGYKANEFEALYSREVINQLEDDIEDDTKLDLIDRKSRRFSMLTNIANYLSTGFMVIGIAILVFYNLITF